jgi:hypothetical protein
MSEHYLTTVMAEVKTILSRGIQPTRVEVVARGRYLLFYFPKAEAEAIIAAAVSDNGRH